MDGRREEMNASLLVTIGIIFVATLIGSVLRARHRDRSLKDFDGYPILIEHRDGRVMWGSLDLDSTGFELGYRHNVDDALMYAKTSYVFYQNEYPNIQAIYRHVDALSPEDRKRRDRSWERAFHPGPFRYTIRTVRNFINTAIDSLMEIVDLFIKGSRPLSSDVVLAPGQTHIKSLTEEVLGYVGTSYDPLLESFVGVQVVTELSIGDRVHEYVGVLREYSARFLELLDVYFPRVVRLELHAEVGNGDASSASRLTAREGGVEVAFAEGELVVRNETPYAVLVREVMIDGSEDRVMRVIATGRSLRYAVLDSFYELGVVVAVSHRLDMILPRDSTLIRHRAERYRPADLFDIVESVELSLEGGTEETRAILEDEAAREQVEMLLRNADRMRPADERLRHVIFDREKPVAGWNDLTDQ
jgi:hypothetical protein